MSKKKKTRHQKIIADLRRKIETAEVSSSPAVSPSLESQKPVTVSLGKIALTPQARPNSLPVTMYSTAFLKHDITKTGILTLSIFLAQFILLFLLKQHIIRIPGLAY